MMRDPIRPFRTLLAPLLLGWALAACAGDAPADGAETTRPGDAGGPRVESADQREVGAYQLTMENVRKWAEVMATPERLSSTEGTADDGDRDGGGETIDEMEVKLASNPRARAAIHDAGLEVREFVLITYAMFLAGLAQAAIDQGADPDSVAAETGIHPGNLRFVDEHRRELDALRQPRAPGPERGV